MLEVALARDALGSGRAEEALAHLSSASARLRADDRLASSLWPEHSGWLMRSARELRDTELGKQIAFVVFCGFLKSDPSLTPLAQDLELFHLSDELVGSDSPFVSFQYMKVLSMLVGMQGVMFVVSDEEGTALGAKVSRIVSVAGPLVADPLRCGQLSFGIDVLARLKLHEDDLALGVEAAFDALRACAARDAAGAPIPKRALIRSSACEFLDSFSRSRGASDAFREQFDVLQATCAAAYEEATSAPSENTRALNRGVADAILKHAALAVGVKTRACGPTSLSPL